MHNSRLLAVLACLGLAVHPAARTAEDPENRPGTGSEEASPEPTPVDPAPAPHSAPSPDTVKPPDRAPADAAPRIPVISTRDLKLRFRLEERGAADISGYIVHHTRDGGRTWSTGSAIDAGSAPGGSVPFQVPGDGRYGFRVTAVDAVGARGPSPAPGDPAQVEAVVDTTPPSIRILRPDREESLPPEAGIEIGWEVRDENLGPDPVEVSFSMEGGPWVTLWAAVPPRGTRTWKVPLAPGRFVIRIRARDEAGHSGEAESPAIRVAEGSPPESRWVAVAPRCRTRRIPLYYRPVHEGDPSAAPIPPENLRRVTVYYRTDGLEWIEGGTDPDRRSPLLFEAPADGWYEIILIGIDRAGRTIPPGTALGPEGRPDLNSPHHARCLVDTVEPRVTIASPTEGTWLEAGGPFEVRYAVDEENPGEKPVTIATSLDAGVTWTVLGEGLEPSPEGNGVRSAGSFELKLPSIESEDFRVRVTAVDAAGNSGEATAGASKPIVIRNPAEDGARKAEEHYRRGLVGRRSSDPVERTRAIESFRRAIAYQANHAAAHHDLAVCLEEEADARPAAAPAEDEALVHFRAAHAAAASDARIALDLVGALIRRAEASTGDGGKKLLDEAGRVFRKISWAGLIEVAGEDREESQRLRRQYREWKETYFNKAPR
jgi:hypothetical protein